MSTAPYEWSNVKPLPKAPRLSPTLVIDRTPQQLADQLDGLRISGGILLDAKTSQTPYEKAHNALVAANVAVAALRSDHTGVEPVLDMLTDVLLAFEDTVGDRVEEPDSGEVEPTLAQEEADAERRAELRA